MVRLLFVSSLFFLDSQSRVCGVSDCVLQEVVISTAHWCWCKEFGVVLLVARLAFLLWWLFIVFLFCCVVYVFFCVFLCYVVLHFGVSTLAHDLMCTPIGFGVSMCLSLWL